MIRRCYSAVIAIIVLISCAPYTSYPPLKVDTTNWPRSDWNEMRFRHYFDSESDLDPIEGIWTMSERTEWINVISGLTGSNDATSKYRFAVIRDSNSIDKFNSFLLESRQEGWLPGMKKATYRKTAYSGAYEESWFMGDFSERLANVIIESGGLITKLDKKAQYPINYEFHTTMLKIYPPIQDNREKPTVVSATSSGSGFLASKSGLVITNYHVVEGTDNIEIRIPALGKSFPADLRIKDINNDLAVLEMKGFDYENHYSKAIPYKIGSLNAAKMGQEVFTLGFPLGSIMGTQARLSTGRINSLYGIDEDPRLLQIGTPLQPGNSGGPLFNMDGEIVGIVVSGLNAKYFYDNLGIIPQNVNFAVKVNYLESLLSMLPGSDDLSKGAKGYNLVSLEIMVEQLNPYIVQVICTK